MITLEQGSKFTWVRWSMTAKIVLQTSETLTFHWFCQTIILVKKCQAFFQPMPKTLRALELAKGRDCLK